MVGVQGGEAIYRLAYSLEHILVFLWEMYNY